MKHCNEKELEGKTMKKSGRVKNWIKEHKKALVVGGIVVAGGVTLLILKRKGVRPGDMIKWAKSPVLRKSGKIGLDTGGKAAESIAAIRPQTYPLAAEETGGLIQAAVNIDQSPIALQTVAQAPTMPFDVSQHIRNLHAGWKASPTKVAEAAARGIELLPGQTLVVAYQKGLKIA